MRVAIIGSGLQGLRRAEALKAFKDDTLVVVTAKEIEHAQGLASKMGCEAAVGWKETISRADIDAVIICTTPESHASIGIEALRLGKHVLCEKPLTRSLEEASEFVKEAQRSKKILKCGFNHRHHPAIGAAKQLFDSGAMGKPVFLRSRYGICGRPGYEKEWRADVNIVGGGQLMEQGIHCVDLFRWFLGELHEATAFVDARYWKISPLEDNAFALLRNKDGVVASLHSSVTQWVNVFSFEVFGEEGYATVDGLGAAYGNERLTVGKVQFDKPFAYETTEFRGGDRSWIEEWKEFRSAVSESRQPLGDGRDGLEAMRVVLACYEASKTRRVVQISA